MFNKRGCYGSRIKDKIAGVVKANSRTVFPSLSNNTQ
jgi:hypothetical protein